jgi:hypothetical protein
MINKILEILTNSYRIKFDNVLVIVSKREDSRTIEIKRKRPGCVDMSKVLNYLVSEGFVKPVGLFELIAK